MNPILKTKLNKRKIKDIRAKYSVTSVDDNFIEITKFCFMSYDLEFFQTLKARVIGITAKDGYVILQLEL